MPKFTGVKDVDAIIQSYVDDLEALDKHKKWFPRFKSQFNSKYFDKGDDRCDEEKLVCCKDCGVWTTNRIPTCWCDAFDGWR